MSDPSDRSSIVDRRTLIRAIAGASLAGLSGCGGDDADATTTMETTRTATLTPSTTKPPTSSVPSRTEETMEPTTTVSEPTTVPEKKSAEYTPPDYATPASFSETELQLDTGCGLGATLSMPDGDGTVPGVVLVHGSGPSDRDETVGPNKLFKDIAWGLASRGIAVLRYDKRTHTCTVSGPFTFDDIVVEDALAALDRLEKNERVGSRFVIGHSMGAMAAPRIAAKAGDLAGAAMLAGNARPLIDVIVEQTKYIANLDGTITDAEQKQIERVTGIADRIHSGSVESDELVLGAPGDFWYSLMDYDQVATAKGLSIPLLIVQGERDYQVSPKKDFGRWKNALRNRNNVSFSLYEGLNHYFIAGSGKSTPEEYSEPGHVAKQVIEDLAEWTKAQA